jgi:hypothetical protein
MHLFLPTLALDKANEVRSVICSHSPHLQQLTTPLGLEVDRSSVYRCRDCKQHPNSSGYSSRNRGAGYCRHTCELQMRHRENKNTFLDRVNQQLLIPRRIYAMIVVFKHKLPGQQQGLLGKLSSSIGQAFFSKEKLTSIRLKSTAIPFQPSPNLNKVLILSDRSVARRTKSWSCLMRRR